MWGPKGRLKDFDISSERDEKPLGDFEQGSDIM